MILCEDKFVIKEIDEGTAGKSAMIIKEIRENLLFFQLCNFTFHKKVDSSEAFKIVKFASTLFRLG